MSDNVENKEFEDNAKNGTSSVEIEDQIAGKKAGANKEKVFDASNASTGSGGSVSGQKTTTRELLMKWAGWLFIIFGIVEIVVATFDIVNYFNPAFDWAEYVAENFVEGYEQSVEQVKLSTFGNAIYTVVVSALYMVFGCMYIKDASIYEDEKFPKNKYLWISILGLLFVSLPAGLVGLIACYKSNKPVASENGDNTNKTSSLDEDDIEEMEEKALKLKQMRDDGILSQEEYEALLVKLFKDE